MGKLQIQPRDGSRDEAARRCQKPLPPPTQSVLSETREGKHICLMNTQRISFKPASKLVFWGKKHNKKYTEREHTGIFVTDFTPFSPFGLYFA